MKPTTHTTGPAHVGYSRPTRDDLIGMLSGEELAMLESTGMLSGEELAMLESTGGGLSRRERIKWSVREHAAVGVRRERVEERAA